jgi:hypothetical protein
MNNIEQELKKVLSILEKNNSTEISTSLIEEQLKIFYSGVKLPVLAKPCLVGDGIHHINDIEFDELLVLHKEAADAGRLIKFVPASGAASRMFKKLQSILNQFNDFTLEDLKKKSADNSDCKSVIEFLINLPKFAFYEDLKTVLNIDDSGIKELIYKSPAVILISVLFDKGLGYSSKPKGAIKFHKYRTENRTAFEEQIYEALHYIPDKDGTVKIHFTISKEHTDIFKTIVDNLKLKSISDHKVEAAFSYQKKSTDTIAVDLENRLIFDKSGNIVQRPGGHGALLENLNDLNGDIVIIKNIDNLSTQNLASDTILYKKLLTGYLVKIQKQVFDLLNSLDRNDFSTKSFEEMMELAEKELYVTKPKDFKEWGDERKFKFLYDKLNRPIRVCGMVKNQGEPGGGPFWIKNEDGSLSLQIVEQAQITMNDESQKKIFQQSTHFNPVDLICGVKDYKDNNFDLHNFIDHKSGIITKKSKDGIELKALELPGLWNGSMADWITIFIEVPINTFNPVKEVNDLLRKEHQN